LVRKGRAVNVAILRGRLSRPPEERLLPSGDVVVSYDVTVPRPGERAETVPVAWVNPPASAADLDVDVEVVVVGRVRRRFFRAGGATQSRTEVVAERVVPTRRRARAAQAVAAALATAGEQAGGSS
ncbi:MAG: single-stranded DNA-binding protein, partial [Actinobacteria bacterium]|nr:single-stranded DNA-binding protein [Actinomycetota bacterium]